MAQSTILSPKTPPEDPSPDGKFTLFRAQESMLILINLALIVLVLVLQLSFQSTLGWPSRTILVLFGIRFLMQTAELQWLNAQERPLSGKAEFWYSRASILMHLIFAAAVSILSRDEDTHYAVLLILPVIAGGFRVSLSGTLFIAACASLVCLFEVWDFNRGAGGIQGSAEYFEAFGTILIFFLVGAVVWLLATNLRKEQAHLRHTMEELESTRDQLVQQEKLAALGRLASGIAHEIRNPIAMIASSLAMAETCADEGHLRSEMLGIATQEARRLEQFTSEFLDYARQREIHKEPTSAESIVRYVADLSRARASENSFAIECDCVGEVTAHVEPFQIHQALLNLLANAMDAATAPGILRIGYRPGPTGGVQFRVENSGTPIPENLLSHLFEPFFTTKPRGTGLGLAIAQKTAQAHGGRLFLDENLPGTIRFVIDLPGPGNPETGGKGKPWPAY